MEDTDKITLAAAVAGGYLLGRTKKGRLALTAALMLAGRGAGLQPRQLATGAARWLAEVPQVVDLREQLREEGADLARKTFSSLTERGVGSLADAISSRTPSAPVPTPTGIDDEDEDEADDSEDAAEEEHDEPAPKPAKKAAKKPPTKKTAPAKKTARTKKAAKTAPAKKSATEKTGPASRSERRR